jgi:hypothetical protein
MYTPSRALRQHLHSTVYEALCVGKSSSAWVMSQDLISVSSRDADGRAQPDALHQLLASLPQSSGCCPYISSTIICGARLTKSPLFPFQQGSSLVRALLPYPLHIHDDERRPCSSGTDGNHIWVSRRASPDSDQKVTHPHIQDVDVDDDKSIQQTY